MQNVFTSILVLMFLAGCGAKRADSADGSGNYADSSAMVAEAPDAVAFDADSAYAYLGRQVEFGQIGRAHV